MTRTIRLAAVLGMLLVMAAGCGKKPVRVDPPPPPVPTELQLGDESLANDRYEEAAQHYQNYLVERPAAPDRDVAVFRRAIALASKSDYQSARILFSRVIALFPRSPYAAESRLILRVLGEGDQKVSELRDREAQLNERDAQLKKVTAELDRLKKIDMERRPVRPPK